MAETIAALQEAGLRDQVKVLIGGAPSPRPSPTSSAPTATAPTAGMAVDRAKTLVAQAATPQAI